MEWFSTHMTQSLIVLGLLLLTVEIVILGFATFILFFVGMAAVATGILMYFSVIPETALSAALAVALLTAIDAALLWKPLKKLQQQVDNKPVKNDLVGLEFYLNSPVSPSENPMHRYSGILWTLTSKRLIPAGAKVKVVNVSVGVMEVAHCE